MAIFKREKEIARTVEFDGLYIVDQGSGEWGDLNANWDKLAIKAKSFPVNYWDKFIKKKVRQKYSDTYDYEMLSSLMGMEKTTFVQEEEGTGLKHALVYLSSILFFCKSTRFKMRLLYFRQDTEHRLEISTVEGRSHDNGQR